MTKLGETARKPGTILMGIGTALALLSLLLCAMVLASTHTEVNPVTGVPNAVQGVPSPVDVLIGVVGFVLIGVGFGMRLLHDTRR